MVDLAGRPEPQYSQPLLVDGIWHISPTVIYHHWGIYQALLIVVYNVYCIDVDIPCLSSIEYGEAPRSDHIALIIYLHRIIIPEHILPFALNNCVASHGYRGVENGINLSNYGPNTDKTAGIVAYWE